MALLDSKENPNLEITHSHHHSSNITLAAEERHTMPPSSPPPPPPHLKKTHHQNHIHVSKKINKNEGFTIKNTNFEVIKRLTSLSYNSSLAAREGNMTTPPPPPPPSPSEEYFKKTHHQNPILPSNKMNKNEGFTIKNTNLEVIKKLNSLSCNSSLATSAPEAAPPPPAPASPEVTLEVEESGRDRLKRHRDEMAGRVRIPDIWGHEDLLKDWIDCTVFDSSLGNKSIMSARAALVQERRSNLRIENQC